MKNLLSFVACLLLSTFLMAQTDTTTVTKTTTTGSGKPSTTNVNINLVDTGARAQAAKTNNLAYPAFHGKPVEGTDWLLVFSPVILFIIILLFINPKLKGFDLKEALQDDVQSKTTQLNPQYTSANLMALAANPAMTTLLTPTIEISTGVYPKSSSRYIALITSILTWTIALCLACYFMYGYILTGVPPELNKLTDMVLTLGIGVVPYAFNKLSEAVKK